MTFCPTLIDLMTAEVGRAALELVPVAGEIGRGINDDRAAAVIDPQERVNVRRKQMLGSPDRMVVGEGLELDARVREELFHQSFEAPVERPAAAAGVGEDESSLFDKRLEVLLGLRPKTRGPRAR